MVPRRTEASFLLAIETAPNIILTDYNLPDVSNVRALYAVQRRGLEIPFILDSGATGEERAVEAIRLGAHDYLLKDRPATVKNRAVWSDLLHPTTGRASW